MRTTYLDNASTSLRKPKAVYEAVKLYRKNGLSAGRSNGGRNGADYIVNKTRGLMQKLLSAYDYNVIFTPSATYSINAFLKGLDFSKINTVYVSPFEHNAVMRVLYSLQKLHKFKIELLKNNDDYSFNIEAIRGQFEESKPDLTIISHISNVCGLLQDYEAVFKYSKIYKSINMLDMAQSCGLIETRLDNSNIDCAIFAGHKTLYSFTGIGGLVIKKGFKLKDTMQGGTGIHSIKKTMPESVIKKLEVGTKNTLAVYSLYYSVQHLLKLGNEKMRQTENKNYKKLLNILKRYDFVKIHGQGKENTSIVAITIGNYSPDVLQKYFDKENIVIRTGLQCSPLAHQTLGTLKNGTIRLSVSLFSKRKDFNKLNKCLREIKCSFK